MCICQPEPERGQGSTVGAVRFTGTLLYAGALAAAVLPSRPSLLVFLLHSLLLLRPAFVFGKEEVKILPPAWDGSAVG